MESTAHLIFLRSDELLISRKLYSDWRQIQDDYEEYMASLGPMSESEIAEYFSLDYGEDDSRWPCSRLQLAEFFHSSAVILECP